MSAPSPIDLLKVEVSKQGSTTIAKIIGSANMVVSSDLKDQLLDLVKESPDRLILDLSELEFISSVGLGGIIAAHLRCRHHNGSVELAAPQPDILELLTITNLTSLFVVHETMEAALASKKINIVLGD